MWDIDVRVGGHLTKNHHATVFCRGLDSDPGVFILPERLIKDRIGDEVTHFIWMSFGDRF
jgi:hypothetical protein